MSKRRHQRKRRINTDGYNLKEQICSSLIICSMAIVGFLPYILNRKFYDEDPSIEYTDGSGDMLIDITNASILSCMMMMWLEALLDSNTLYIPIKIAFPRFLMVFGVLIVSLSFYFVEFDETDRLQYLVCMQFAKGFFICGGLSLKLVADAIEKRSYTWVIYVLATFLFSTDFLLHQWAAYYPKTQNIFIAMTCISSCSGLLSVYFLYKVFQLSFSKKYDEKGSYDVMSHLVVCVFYYGNVIVDLNFPSKTWKETTAAEMAGYNFVGLFATVLFFFTSSHIAQCHFVVAKGQLINKKSFVRYVSHEIRTPLNTVYVGIQLLTSELKKMIEDNKSGSSEKDCAKKLQDIVHDINESCSISIDILNDLLLIDKIEEGNLNLEIKPENAKCLFESCIQHFDVQALYSNINLSVDLQALSNVTVNVDETKIVQVVRNIVSNALKFTPSGGHIQVNSSFVPASDIDSSSFSGGGFVKLKGSASRVYASPVPGTTFGKIRMEFLDTGPGISEDNKAKLFESVVQFDPNVLQNGGGSGLGLFISNAIVKRHSGGVIGVMSGGVESVGVDGEEGGVRLTGSDTAKSGSMFFIEMDGRMCVTPDESDRVGHVIDFIDNGGLTIGDSRTLDIDHDDSKSNDDMIEFDKVLVVEDSKFNRKMMTKALTPYAHEIILAEDGVEGVKAVRECIAEKTAPFDVIFMDSLMPNMNGIDATKIILRELKFPNPIVAVTGNMLPEDVREFEEAGALTVLGKPLQLDKLDKVLRGIHSNESLKI